MQSILRLTALFLMILSLLLPLFASAEDSGTGSETATDLSASPARGYILLSFSQGSYWLPLPDEEDYTLPIHQTRPDGKEELNLIHVTPEGFYMEESTCENQDCVEQGMVTLDNRKERILGGYVICLPNEITLVLYTPEEILQMFTQTTEGE